MKKPLEFLVNTMVFASLLMLSPWACAVLLIVRLLFYEGNLWRGRASLRSPGCTLRSPLRVKEKDRGGGSSEEMSQSRLGFGFLSVP